MGSSQSSTSSSSDGSAPKKSLYQRAQEKKRGPGTSGLSDEDLKKYTGKTRAEFDAWKETTPGVGKNQLAGKLAVGPTSGLGGAGPGPCRLWSTRRFLGNGSQSLGYCRRLPVD